MEINGQRITCSSINEVIDKLRDGYIHHTAMMSYYKEFMLQAPYLDYKMKYIEEEEKMLIYEFLILQLEAAK